MLISPIIQVNNGRYLANYKKDRKSRKERRRRRGKKKREKEEGKRKGKEDKKRTKRTKNGAQFERWEYSLESSRINATSSAELFAHELCAHCERYNA